MLERLIFDTEAILAYFLGEEGAETVRDCLRGIQKGEVEGYINVVNLTEFYYILCRLDKELAEQKLRNLRLYGLKVVPIEDDNLWREAACIKSGHSLSLADAFAVATAKTLKARLVVGSDREFENLGVSLLRVRE